MGMKCVNEVRLFGRVATEIRATQLGNGQLAANFRLITNKQYTDGQGEAREVSQGHALVAYGPPAQIIERYVKKGDRLMIEGSLNYRSYDKEGVTQYVTEILVEEVYLIELPRDAESASTDGPPGRRSPPPPLPGKRPGTPALPTDGPPEDRPF